MKAAPTATKMLMMVMAGVEAADAPNLPDFDRIQRAVKYGESKMPMVRKMGLRSETHELEQLISQTIDLGYMAKYNNTYFLTERGKGVLWEGKEEQRGNI